MAKITQEVAAMSYADRIFKDNCREILTHGVWDTDQNVRPHWEDGTPAHTVKKFGIVNRYDLKAEFPILTIRRTYFKTCIDELLWIWQQKSNNIHDLRGHIWHQHSLRVEETAYHHPDADCPERQHHSRYYRRNLQKL